MRERVNILLFGKQGCNPGGTGSGRLVEPGGRLFGRWGRTGRFHGDSVQARESLAAVGEKGETILYLTGFANCNKIEAVTRMDTQFFVGNTTSVFVHLAMMMILMMIVVMIVVMILMMILMMMQKIVDTVWPHMLKWGERHKVTFLH